MGIGGIVVPREKSNTPSSMDTDMLDAIKELEKNNIHKGDAPVPKVGGNPASTLKNANQAVADLYDALEELKDKFAKADEAIKDVRDLAKKYAAAVAKGDGGGDEKDATKKKANEKMQKNILDALKDIQRHADDMLKASGSMSGNLK